MKKVILTALNGLLFTQAFNEDGTAKLDKNGKSHGFIRVSNPHEIDLSYAYQNGGIKQGISALIAMPVEQWEKNKAYYKEGMEIPGQIIAMEDTKQVNPGYKLKKAGNGENAPTCKIQGQDIWRTTVYTKDQNATSVLIAHDNVDELKAYQASLKEEVKLTGAKTGGEPVMKKA